MPSLLKTAEQYFELSSQSYECADGHRQHRQDKKRKRKEDHDYEKMMSDGGQKRSTKSRRGSIHQKEGEGDTEGSKTPYLDRRARRLEEWKREKELEKEKIGCGPINTLSQVFSDPHVKAREMIVNMDHKKTGKSPLKLIANPIKMHKTPPSYRLPPPLLGEHTDEILSKKLVLVKQR